MSTALSPIRSSAAHEFDSDITDDRYPRAVLGLGGGLLLTVGCAPGGGMTLAELAELMVGLGARSAINLHGGGSTSLAC
jgi:exopolysaccharide biosynthesis protein